MTQHRGRAIVLLVATTVVWGATFVVVQDALSSVGPFWFSFLRFALAVVFIAPFARRVNRKLLKSAWPAGVALGLGYTFQTAGLKFTSATKAGFITGLFVVFAPAIASIVYRRRLAPRSILAIAIALTGLALLTQASATSVNVGDLLVVGCALFFAIQIVLLERLTASHDTLGLTAVQIITATFVFVPLLPFDTPPTLFGPTLFGPTLFGPTFNGGLLWALAITGILATAGGFFAQTYAQSKLSVTQVAIILTLEPVFAGIFGYLLAGDVLEASQWVGAAAVMVACALVLSGRSLPQVVTDRVA